MPSMQERFEHMSALFATKLLGPEAKLDAIRVNIGLLAKALDVPFGVLAPEDTSTLDERTIVKLAYELAEAKAEIERLRKERDSAELKLETLKSIDGRILADAEIGRLVLGMSPMTSLHCLSSGQRYSATTRWQKGKHERQRHVCFRDDPAEALRAIQEVDDAEVS